MRAELARDWYGRVLSVALIFGMVCAIGALGLSLLSGGDPPSTGGANGVDRWQATDLLLGGVLLVPAFGYVALVAGFWRERWRDHVVLALLQLIVFAVVAIGIV